MKRSLSDQNHPRKIFDFIIYDYFHVLHYDVLNFRSPNYQNAFASRPSDEDSFGNLLDTKIDFNC